MTTTNVPDPTLPESGFTGIPAQRTSNPAPVPVPLPVPAPEPPIAPAPPYGPYPFPPPAAERPKFGLGARIAVGLVVAIAGVFILAAVHRPAPVPQTPAQAYQYWLDDGGQARINTLVGAMNNVSTAASGGYLSVTECANLADAAASADHYTPIPDPIAQGYWSNGVRYVYRAATECENGFYTNAPALFPVAATDLNNSSKEIDKALARLHEIGMH